MMVKHLLNRLSVEVELEPCTLAQYGRALEKFGGYLGREAEVHDLTVDCVNQFLAALKAKGLTGTTVRNYRVSLTRLWNFAVSEGLCPPFDIRKLRSPKIDRRPVRAWSSNQVSTLLESDSRVEGKLKMGLLRSDLLVAWIQVGYDTGLRPTDLRMLRWDDVDLESSRVIITQHKTHKPHTAVLSTDSIQSLLRIERPTRSRVFPLGKGGMRKLELLLFSTASLSGFRRSRGQGLGTLRKTHATAIYEAEGEHAAAESLGHVGGTRTVRASYIDSRSIRAGRLPPRLLG
jgi:integrase